MEESAELLLSLDSGDSETLLGEGVKCVPTLDGLVGKQCFQIIYAIWFCLFAQEVLIHGVGCRQREVLEMAGKGGRLDHFCLIV